MALWTDVIDPASLTGYARESLSSIEARKGTLARWLPNQDVFDTVARFVTGQAGLVEEAKFRAYDAEPEIGKGPAGKRVTLELPALGQNIPVTEYMQLRTRNASDEAVLSSIQRTTDQVVQAVADRIERLRATIDQDNYKTDDDFGRKAGHTVTAATLWSVGGADPLADLAAWVDVYVASNGVEPGSIVLSRRILRSLAAHASFRVTLAGGGSRSANISDVVGIIEGAGLPQVIQYDRSTSVGRVIPDNRLLLLPEPVEVNDADGTKLGGTFWGQTLTSTDSNYGIGDAEQPGIVAGVYRNEKPPMIAEVISDAIALPVLANADLSFAATVL